MFWDREGLVHLRDLRTERCPTLARPEANVALLAPWYIGTKDNLSAAFGKGLAIWTFR